MTRPGDKNWLPHDEWLRRMPKKRVSAGLLIMNEQKGLLIVKPSYKDYWTIPGGVVEQYESPIDGCVREVYEEIGLCVSQPKFIGLVHAPRRTENDDVLHFFFYGGALSSQEIANIHLQADELEDFRFVVPSDIKEFVIPHFAEKLPALLQAIQEEEVVYLE